ncbi:peptidyl-prolyl cis-trans isomerase Pin1 [Coemansia interrupta]|uniref:Peptidyl-prolyl cis-trans isomerase n=1 Tax=Coemansia interrupta TaxID=1126814 RepID=A0A9W8LJW6_9FUNG|nr:peptidyl-prolyl cis-trans isomerase Pin1 [Coemansia interrupta]
MGSSNKHSALPPNWVIRKSSKYNKDYYFNEQTGESRWDPPTGTPPKKKAKLRARHILAKHVGSRRPSSWREENITRTKEEAEQKISLIREDIASGRLPFEDIAAIESDCSSAKRGGDLGWFEEGQMQPAFENAVKSLAVGELSQLVYSDSGVHIIERTG